MEDAITKAEKALKEAQDGLAAAVAARYPVGSTVSYNGIRGKETGTVTAVDGLTVIIGKVRRGYDKLS